jgi:hypothetical protein
MLLVVLRDWPPRSPHLIPCDFYLWGYVKDQVYQPLMPQSLRELQERILQAIANVGESQLWRTWEKLEYRFDVCRVPNGADIEHL